ncbi:MAG TPA: 5-formyltetrahydrofolate cyclo-ligase [Steroidobacteraceae bacterium]|nr:5-formyltetrahydrofolate cyclo-ligase [Steroidobacteraceae bacterium]
MKAKLRKELRRNRRSLNPAEHARRSRMAAAFVARLAAFKSGARIAIYLPFDGEADPVALAAAARRRGIRLYVPVVVDLAHRRLRFYPLAGKTRRGTFGISIPHGIAHRHALAPRWFDLIVVPSVGVDADGRRLGMGGGFYDRALGFRRHRRHWPGPRLVGLAFDCQRAASVFAEAFDVRLDALATESGLQHFSRDNP